MKQIYVDTDTFPGVWKKGQLHTHSNWSDGRAFPEEVIWIYKELGFDFLCLSDHNVFQDKDDVWLHLCRNEEHWMTCPTVGQHQRICRLFGEDVCDTRSVSFRKFVRLSTYRELAQRFNEAGKFTLVPGAEITMQFNDGQGRLYSCHSNYLNLCEELAPLQGRDNADSLRLHYENYAAAAAKSSAPSFYMLNHPWWRNWDILPADLLANPEVRHFEICNSGTSYSSPEYSRFLTPDKFWDIVLAHRLEDGQPMLYASASDDAHNYHEKEKFGEVVYPNAAWVFARVPDELTPDNICRALNKGDYYPTTGIILNKVEYDPASRELHVAVQAEPGVDYRIEFYGTRRGFDRNVISQTITHPTAPQFTREMPVYSDEIGRMLKSVNGAEAVCAANADDLYIRAKIVSDIPSGNPECCCHPAYRTAWTQPVQVK